MSNPDNYLDLLSVGTGSSENGLLSESIVGHFREIHRLLVTYYGVHIQILIWFFYMQWAISKWHFSASLLSLGKLATICESQSV